MRIAIYARVSTKDQSCELQLRDLRAYCAARKFEAVREYVDVGQFRRKTQFVVWRLDLAQRRAHTAAEPVKAASSRDEDSLESPSTQRRLSHSCFKIGIGDQ